LRSGAVLLWIFACNYIPGWFGGARNPACEIHMQKANDIFGIMNTIFFCGWIIVFSGINIKGLLLGRNI
jgi:hypothetical protein